MFSHFRSLSVMKSACMCKWIFAGAAQKISRPDSQSKLQLFTLFTDAILEDQVGSPTWRLHTKLYNFARNIRRISQPWANEHTVNLKNCTFYLSLIISQFHDFIYWF